MALNNPNGGVQWSADHDAELRLLAESGAAYRAIAAALNEKFGTNYSKNAVVGRAQRISLAKKAAVRQPSPIRRPKSPLAAPRRRTETLRIVPANGNSNVMRVFRTVTMERTRIRCVGIEPRHLAFNDIERWDCRYVYGDGPFTFCGHAVQEGSSYCPGHHDLCWERPKKLIDKTFVRAA